MKKYICTGTWKRNNKGDIISEYDYKRMPIEAKKNNYEEYVPPVAEPQLILSQSIEIVTENPMVENPVTSGPGVYHSKIKKTGTSKDDGDSKE